MKIIRIITSVISILTLTLAILLFISQDAYAQQFQQITITPPKIEVTLSPGEKAEGTFGIINDSDIDMNFVTGVYDFIVTDTNGTPEILPSGTLTSNKYSGASWIAIDPITFTVKQHQRFDANYYIQVPNDAAAGGHYAALIYQPVTSPNQASTGTHIQSQIATLVLITVKGTVKEFAQVTKFHAPSFLEYGPVHITTQIRNLGDLHITPKATIAIKDVFGRTVMTSDLDQKNIFPGNNARTYENTLGNTLMIGKFTASLLGSYGSSGSLPLFATITFWVFPWRIGVMSILILLVIILGLLLLKKRKDTDEDELSAFDDTKDAS